MLQIFLIRGTKLNIASKLYRKMNAFLKCFLSLELSDMHITFLTRCEPSTDVPLYSPRKNRLCARENHFSLSTGRLRGITLLRGGSKQNHENGILVHGILTIAVFFNPWVVTPMGSWTSQQHLHIVQERGWIQSKNGTASSKPSSWYTMYTCQYA